METTLRPMACNGLVGGCLPARCRSARASSRGGRQGQRRGGAIAAAADPTHLAGVASSMGPLLDVIGHHVHAGAAHLRLPPLGFEAVTAPCSSLNCGDIVYRSTLDPALRMENKGVNPFGVALLGLLGLYLTARPGVLEGAIDFYILAPLDASTRIYDKSDFSVGKKLAQGGFGSVYRAELRSNELEDAKPVIVKKATEFGEAEVWMNERLSRSAPGAVAGFVTAFSETSASDDAAATGFGLLNKVVKKKKPAKKQGPPPLWLVWEYEGTETLFSAMSRKDFPQNLEKTLLGRELNIAQGSGRKLVMYKLVAEQILEGLAAIHRTGVVHRDVKPQNVLVSETDMRLKHIDFGAAADLRVGINYVPNEFLLDPRFAPPQQYIMSTQTPNAPPLPIAACLSPILWALNRPDKFDMYSTGIMLMQVCFPPLRSDNAIIAFNKKLGEKYNYSLAAWRRGEERSLGKDMREALQTLDVDGGQLWDLLTQLVVYEPSQRLSAEQAMKHPAFGKASGVLYSISNAAGEVGKKANDLLDDDGWLLATLSGDEGDLTEADVAAMSAERQKPTFNPKTSNTIAWWSQRQSAMDQKLSERRALLRKKVVQTIKLTATKTISNR